MPNSERWSSAEFVAGLTTFVETAVGPVRLAKTKMRPWSAVWRATTPDGSVFWVKQNCEPSRFEGSLLVLLGQLVPQRALPVVAVDDCGLVLSPDQGAVLGFDHDDPTTWARIVGEWALVQRETATHADRLVDVGVPTLPLDGLVAFARDRVAMLRALSESDPRRLREHDAERVLAGLPAVAEAVDVVGSLGLPAALVHNDLHGNNVFAGSGDRPLRFFDLGDAVLSHPSFDLVTPLGGLVDLLGCAPDDPRLWRVADAWAEVWTDLAPMAAIRTALPHAMRLARLSHVESWLRMTPGMSPQEAIDWGAAGAEWIGALPDPPLLAPALI